MPNEPLPKKTLPNESLPNEPIPGEGPHRPGTLPLQSAPLGQPPTSDLTILTPDYVIQLAYVAFLMKSVETPHERESMRQLWEHFLTLNAAYPPTTNEGLFLDRIEATAFTAAELMHSARQQYDDELQLADDEYSRDMGREVAIGLSAGVWGATAKVGILIGVGAFAGLLFKGVAGFTERAVEDAASGTPNNRLTTVSLAIAVGTTLLEPRSPRRSRTARPTGFTETIGSNIGWPRSVMPSGSPRRCSMWRSRHATPGSTLPDVLSRSSRPVRCRFCCVRSWATPANSPHRRRSWK